MKMWKVLFMFKPHRRAIELLSSDKNFKVIYFETRNPPPELVKKELASADVLVVAPYHKIGKDLLDEGRKLKLLVIYGSGYEKVDIKAATERGICVANAPNAIAESVAEHALALTLALMRKVVISDRAIREGKWASGPAPREFLGSSLKGKRVGIIGLGKIGATIARLFKAVGAEVCYWNRRRKMEVERALNIQYMELGDLLSTSDVLIVSLALTPDTKNFINKERISKMKRGAILVNISRGEIVEEEALLEALESGILGGAALDVYAKEPLPPDHKLIKCINTILTPHIAGYTREAMMGAAEEVVEIIKNYFLKDKEPATALNLEVCRKSFKNNINKY